MHRAAIQCGSQVCAKRATPCGEVAAESAPAHFCVRKGERLVSQTHRKDSARFLASDSHPQTTTHHTPAGHHLLSNQAPLASPERPCVRQHPLPRPGYQRATAQQRRPPASTRLLLTSGLPLRADLLELLWVPGCLLFPSCCCCCCWHSTSWRRHCSFSRASSLSIRCSMAVRCLSRERKAAEKEPLCPSGPGHFLLSHSHGPAPGCFAAVVPAAASSCLSKAPNTDCTNVFAAGTTSFHRWALLVYSCWNMRIQDFSQGPQAPFKSKRYSAFSYLCLLFLSPPVKLFLCSCSSHSRRRETSIGSGSSGASSNLARSCRSFF